MGEEKNFENKVKAFLKNECGAFLVKYWGGGKFTSAGIPDLLVCINGYFMGVELKASDGHPTMLQLQKLESIVNANGVGILLYPKDFKAFKRFCLRVSKNDEIPASLYSVDEFHGFLKDWWFYYDDIRTMAKRLQ